MLSFFSILSVLLCTFNTCSAVPFSKLRRPVFVPADVVQNTLLRRAVSLDASCPDGFLCESDRKTGCPSGTQCPSGDVCIDFGGELACASDDGIEYCAFNADSFEAVACSQGICCHGQCYKPNSVCCTNDSVKCKLNTACNVCSPGQTCGASGCLGSGPGGSSVPPPATTIPATTVVPPKTTTKDTPSISTKPPGKPTTTEKPTSEEPPTELPTSSTTEKPAPTVVSHVGNFENLGCFQDPDINNRVLRADNSEDSNGMTVEKCVSFAQKNDWKYAGVEFGSQCFVGNTLWDAPSASQADCSQVCAGDDSELCGNWNRVQVYSDSTWFSPTLAEVQAALKDFNETLAEAKSAVAQYQTDIEKYRADGGSIKTKRSIEVEKRQEGPVLTGILRADLENIQADFKMIKVIQSTLKSLPVKNAERSLKVWKLGLEIDIKITSAPPVTPENFETLQDAVVQISTDVIGNVANAAEADNALIEPALAQDVVPVLDVASDLAVVSTAITSIGVSAIGEAAATGILAVIASLLGALSGNPGGGNPTKPPSTTEPATTTTTSSTTCTATTIQTPIIIMTKKGTTKAQYNELVNSLPKNQNNVQKTDSWLPNWIYIATLDQCTSEALWKNSIVQAMSINAKFASLDPSESDSADDSTRSTANKREASVNDTLQGRAVPGPESKYLQQTPNSPGHLNWLTQLSRYTQLTGSFLDFEEFIFDDGAAREASLSTVYVIDRNLLNTHTDFASRVIAQLGVNADGTSSSDQVFTFGSHGTCMVSLAAGSYSGVAKRAKIVTVQLPDIGGTSMQSDVARAVFALLSVLEHATSTNSQGHAVVSMSFSIPRDTLWWSEPTQAIPQGQYTDPFEVYIPQLIDEGIVPVCSAGNAHDNANPAASDLSANTPRAAGGSDTGLIVVGNAQYDGTRHSTSQYLDSFRKGILSLYNVGTMVDCAVLDPRVSNPNDMQGTYWRTENPGASQATAITAGMVAYYLADPVIGPQLRAVGISRVAANVKTFLQTNGRVLKGDVGTGDGIPRAALGDRIPCQGGTAGRPAIPPVFTPGQNNGRLLLTQQVTDGETVLVNPECWNLQ
ncbi:hypothetical protein AK830_g5169 [Neonectria ditissima]|uniref:WSC domain-containing protein n=1 Tax=Neonectria ditissima TaxID=78410 RepID=A0A0P7B5X4_9HYPO|nr:hypothetical protein AK830_g5169 [Neonectria ditissima]